MAWAGRLAASVHCLGPLYVNKMSARLGACLAAAASHTRRAVQGWLWAEAAAEGPPMQRLANAKALVLAAACVLRGKSCC